VKRRSDRATIRFDLLYEDGSRSSNRPMPANLLDGIDGDTAAQTYFESQERLNANRSGLPPRAIKQVVRSAN
jgi:hypothetical protein